jgi:small-conductance mechanosensitive channel
MTRLAGIDIPAAPLIVVPVFLLLLLALSVLIARLIGRLTAGWLGGHAAVAARAGAAGDTAARPPTGPTLGLPIAIAVLAGGIQLVFPELALPAHLARWSMNTLMVVLVIASAIALARIAVAGVTEYAARHPSVTPALGVVRVATRVVVTALAGVMALQTLGVPVAPLLTTLGIGSLAVALALQDTLANFFAGLYLLADRPVRSGDYIKIHDGEEGYVEAIGWRSSRLRTQKNNTVIVPNQKLSQAILTNYHLPQPAVAMSIPVTVPYDADPAAVEALLLDTLSTALPQLAELQGSDVSVRLSDFGDSGLVFTCGVLVRDFEAQARAGHELRKRLLARLRQEGIQIPYPQRVIHSIPARAAEGPRGPAPPR